MAIETFDGITHCQILRASFKTPPFARSLRQSQILSLKISNIFLRLKFSPSFTSNKIEHFEIGSLFKNMGRHKVCFYFELSGSLRRITLQMIKKNPNTREIPPNQSPCRAKKVRPFLRCTFPARVVFFHQGVCATTVPFASIMAEIPLLATRTRSRRHSMARMGLKLK